MTWTRELADDIREAARIVGTDQYNWGSPCNCNAAILMRVCFGVDVDGFCDLRVSGMFNCGPHGHGAYQDVRVSGAVADRLGELGLRLQDIAALETLTDCEIRKRAGLPPLSELSTDRACASSVQSYLLAWADMIDDHLGPREAVPVEIVPAAQLVVEVSS